MCSDHFAPWRPRRGQSGSPGPGSARPAGRPACLGVVNAPRAALPPAIVAQAAATLGEMFPRRFGALGVARASNEHITGDPGRPSRRRARLREAVEVMRPCSPVRRSATTASSGSTGPGCGPPPSGRRCCSAAAVSSEDRRAGLAAGPTGWSPWTPLERARGVVAAFRDGGGEGKPIFLQVHLSWAADEEAALAVAHDQWARNVSTPLLARSWPARAVRRRGPPRHPEDVRSAVLVSADLGRHTAWLAELRRARGQRHLPPRGRAGPAAVHRRLRGQGHPLPRGRAGRAAPATRPDPKVAYDLWWKNAVVYCVDVELFADGDGDGVGDFPRLEQTTTSPAWGSPASG